MPLDAGGDGDLRSGAWTSAGDQRQMVHCEWFMHRNEAIVKVEKVGIIVCTNQHTDDTQEVQVVDVVKVVPDVGNHAFSLSDYVRPDIKVQDVIIIEI